VNILTLPVHSPRKTFLAMVIADMALGQPA
jgi:hypothetical protein